MKAIHLLSLSVLILIFGCRPEIIDPPADDIPDDSAPELTYVDFENPKPGQETFFIRYESVCDSLEEAFHYTGDTLRLMVMEENDTLYFEESFTPNSPMFINGLMPEPYRQKLIDQEGRILIPERLESPLFFFYGNDTLHLRTEKKVPLYKVGCRIFNFQGPFIGNDIGEIEDFSFADISLKEKTVVSCVPTPWNMEAYLVYSEDQLFMSHQIMESFGMVSVQGWVKLEKE